MSAGGGVREHYYYLDKDGALFFEGNPIDDPWTFRLFQRTMLDNGDGRYLVICDGEYCYIQVEDVPYVVKNIEILSSPSEGVERVELLFGGGYKQVLDPQTLFVGEGNVLYCKVRKGRFTARFSRKPYYSLAELIECKDDKSYFVRINNKEYIIKLGG